MQKSGQAEAGHYVPKKLANLVDPRSRICLAELEQPPDIVALKHDQAQHVVRPCLARTRPRVKNLNGRGKRARARWRAGQDRTMAAA